MKNKLLSFFYFIAIYTICLAQKPIIKWGASDKITSGFHSLIADDKGQLIKI